MPVLLALEGLLLLAERFGWFTFDRHKGYAPLLAIAAVGAVLALMLLWFLTALSFAAGFNSHSARSCSWSWWSPSRAVGCPWK